MKRYRCDFFDQDGSKLATGDCDLVTALPGVVDAEIDHALLYVEDGGEPIPATCGTIGTGVDIELSMLRVSAGDTIKFVGLEVTP